MKGTWQGSGTWKTTSSGGGLVLVAAVVLIGSGAASAIASAVMAVLIITGSVIGLAVLGGFGFLIYRARQERPGWPIAAPVVRQLPPEIRLPVTDSSRPAIGPAREVHIHLHGLTPDQLAAIVTGRVVLPGQLPGRADPDDTGR